MDLPWRVAGLGLVASWALAGCGPATRCGEGTVLRDGACVVSTDDAADRDSADTRVESDGPSADTRTPDAVTPDVDAAFADTRVESDVPRTDTRAPDVITLDAGFDAEVADVALVDVVRVDAPAGDAGPIEIRPDDTLLISPGSATTVPGLLLCPTFTLLRIDGARVPVTPGAGEVTARPNNTAVLQESEPGDCGAFRGVLTLTPGSSTVRWTLTSRGASVSNVVPINVVDGWVDVQASDDLVLPVGANGGYILGSSRVRATGGTFLASGVLVPRWFSGLRSEPADVLEVTPAELATRLTVRARALGTARIVGAYGPPGRSRPISGTGTITVTNAGVLEGVSTTYRGTDGDFRFGEPWALAPGACVEVQLDGWYRTTVGLSRLAYRLPVTDAGVTFTTSGDGRVELGPPTRVCATTRGEFQVRGCFMGFCSSQTIPVVVSGEALMLSLAPAEVSIPRDPGGGIRGCLPVRATLRYADGTTRDVTNSRATGWGTIPTRFLTRDFDRDGAPVNNTAGDPCFSGHGDLGIVNFGAGYARASAPNIVLRIVPL